MDDTLLPFFFVELKCGYFEMGYKVPGGAYVSHTSKNSSGLKSASYWAKGAVVEAFR